MTLLRNWIRVGSQHSTQRQHAPKSLSSYWKLLGTPVASAGHQRRFGSCFNPHRRNYAQYSNGPPGLLLGKAILRSPTELLLATTKDRKSLMKLRKIVFNRLELKLPTKLPSIHNDSSSMHASLSSMVVEETLYTIVEDLEKRYDLKQEKVVGKRSTPVRIVEDDPGSSFFRCFTYQPLSNSDRNDFRAGAVVFLMPKGAERNHENLIFGVIQLGSFKSEKLPRDMKKKHAQNEKFVEKGDKLAFLAFGESERQVETHDDMEMYFVTSILNFQRQFTACKSPDKKAIFRGALLGSFANDGVSDENNSASGRKEVVNEAHHADVIIPILNEKQQEAADDFLSAEDSCIKIVQGPPGTGKTTMTVAIICRHILQAKARGDPRPLLVCGPTNKSVVVLALKVLRCVRNDKSINTVLIGDKEDLLADNKGELEDSFVHNFMSIAGRKWRGIETQLLRTLDIERFDDESRAMISEINGRLPTINLVGVETALEDVKDQFEDSFTTDEDDKLVKLEKALRGVGQKLRNIDAQQVVQDLLENANVIFCTLIAAGQMPMKRMGSVSDLIVDEAGACTEPELLVPLRKDPKRLLLVGDPKQLPSTVRSPEAKKHGLDQSLQERLMYRCKFNYTLLNVQYRMRPEISRWPFTQFYDNKVDDGSNVCDDSYTSRVSLLQGDPYTWVQVSGEEMKDANMSTMNVAEGDAIISLLLDMKKKFELSNDWFSPDRIRIITFYKGQEALIRLKLRQYNLNVVISTVDSIQGGEADMIILSFVRGSSGHMGFIKDAQRLNVAMTRAKYQLVCVGNLDAISVLHEKGGNLVLRSMAVDAIANCRIEPAPGPLPPQPKRTGNKNTKNRKKNKKNKKKRIIPQINKGAKQVAP